MKTTVHIFVLEKLGSLLNTRGAVTNLMEEISKIQSAEIELDFVGVEFMSRSFADQFHKDQKSFQEKTKRVLHVINANEEIIRMLQIVSNTQDKKEREFAAIPVYRFSDKVLLSNYLLSI